MGYSRASLDNILLSLFLGTLGLSALYFGFGIGVAHADSVIATIPVGFGPGSASSPEGIAFDSANGNLYVANEDSSTVSVIATSGSTQLTLNTIPWQAN